MSGFTSVRRPCGHVNFVLISYQKFLGLFSDWNVLSEEEIHIVQLLVRRGNAPHVIMCLHDSITLTCGYDKVFLFLLLVQPVPETIKHTPFHGLRTVQYS